MELDSRNEKLGFKVREARLRRVPYMVVIGDKEAEERLVAPRSRTDGELGAMSIEDFIGRIKAEDAPLS